MNKKGFLLAEETLKIILAVISIGFLVYFLGALYFANQNSEKLEQAKASLEFLINEINSMKEEIREVQIYNPEGWVISSWPHKVLKGTPGFREEVNDIPNSCSNLNWENCICICEDTIALNLEGSDCDNKGKCMESDYSVEGDVIKIDEVPLTLNIKDGKITK